MQKTATEIQFTAIETSVVTEVMEELARATAKHGPYPTIHHGVGVIDEEYIEFKTEAYRQKVDGAALRKECIQLAATAIRFLLDLNPCGCKDTRDPLYGAAEVLAKFDNVPVATMLAAMNAAVETQQPQYVHRADGTKRMLLPTDTNRIVVDPPAVEVSPALYAPYGKAEERALHTAPMPDTVDEELAHLAHLNDALGG